MSWVQRFAKSSIGAKYAMALSGLVLLSFVLVHMLGNMQVFLGPEAYNKYAYFLKSTPELLWPARIGLIFAVLVHIVSGLRLAALNKAARPHDYKKRRFRDATWMSRHMAITGLLVLTFIVYHLAHFTFGLTDPSHYELKDPLGHHDVFSMLVHGFQNRAISAFYIMSMVGLAPHLWHGASSYFQSLGINHPRFNTAIRAVGPVFAAVVVLANISMPLAVMCGLITLPAGGM